MTRNLYILYILLQIVHTILNNLNVVKINISPTINNVLVHKYWDTWYVTNVWASPQKILIFQLRMSLWTVSKGDGIMSKKNNKEFNQTKSQNILNNFWLVKLL